MSSELAYSFGYFRLLPDRRLLLGGEEPIKVGARAFDLLVALVGSSGRMLTKGELLEIVWPGLVVEENNLNVQVVVLRKIIGHAAIATIPGRGYRFVMPVKTTGSEVRGVPASTAPISPRNNDPVAEERLTNLSGEVPALYGRGEDLSAVQGLLADHRVVTITGAGGIGKTRLAQAAAHRLLSSHPDGVWWVELAALTDAALVGATVARALGLDADGTRPALSLVVAALRSRRAVLVLDNCEHLIDAVATFVEDVRASTVALSILVTSQEALKANEEYVYRLGTLTVPKARPGMLLTQQEVAASGAGALFVARARAVEPRFQLNAGNLDAVGEICRCLDGIPLAIELAAARLPLLGAEGVRTRLKERFNVLTGGTRAALRRHQTLRAALEWSHGLLSDAEQIVFRRLGVFAGGFTLESAQRVCEDDTIDVWDVLEHLGTLVDKSLVLAEGTRVPRYRLLETTRLYALEQLGHAGETESMLRQHAKAMVTLLAAYGDKALQTTPEEDVLVAAEADNVRAALDWLAGRAAPEPDMLDIQLGTLASLSLIEAGGVSEAFDRTLALAPRVSETASSDVVGRFWLALAQCGAVVARPEAYAASLRAIEVFRATGNDELRFVALGCRIAIGARLGESPALSPFVEEARRIERDEWARPRHTWFQWACYRWLQAEGRPEEALDFALARAALHRHSGAPLLEQITYGDNVADCELAMGRLDAAAAHCHEALAQLEGKAGYAWGRSHVLETLAFVSTTQGRDQDAIRYGRAAILSSRDVGMHFRLLEAIALTAARQGRLADAAFATGHVDRLYAQRGEVRWPYVQVRRQELDKLLESGLDQRERAGLAAAGAESDSDVAFERAFGEDQASAAVGLEHITC